MPFGLHTLEYLRAAAGYGHNSGVVRRRNHGSSVVEFAFLTPWFVFLFVGILDMGYYNYALITAQSAARTAVLYTSSNTSPAPTDATTACTYVYDQLTSNINLNGATDCNGTSPITLTATQISGPDGNPAANVVIQFTSPLMIPIPGILPASFSVVRSATMLIRTD